MACGKSDGKRAECAQCRAWFHNRKDDCSYVCDECDEEHRDRLFERQKCHDEFYDKNAQLYPFHGKHKHLQVFMCFLLNMPISIP